MKPPRRPGRARLALALLCMLVACVARLAAPRPAGAAPVALSVNNTTVIQPDWLGAGVVYHGFQGMPESTAQGETPALASLDYARMGSIGVPLVRTWYGSDWAMPTWGGAYNWSSPKMAAFEGWLAQMQAQHVAVALNVGWWSPQSTCSPGLDACTPQVPQDVNVFAHWASDSVNELVSVLGYTNVKYLVLFTEPNGAHGTLPAGYTAQSYYNYVVRAVQSQLTADGRRGLVQLIGPNLADFGQGGTLADAVANDGDVFDAYSAHSYNQRTFSAWTSLITGAMTTAAGKPFWLDEYGDQDATYRASADYGTDLALINAAALDAGVQTTLLWEYGDQYYVWPLDVPAGQPPIDAGTYGLQPWLPTSTQVRPAWYAYSLLSRYMGGAGTQVYSTTGTSGGLDIAAVRRPDGNISVLVVNENAVAASFAASFAASIGGRTLFRHAYDPAQVPTTDRVPGTSARFGGVTTAFSDTLPARGVAVYTTDPYTTAGAATVGVVRGNTWFLATEQGSNAATISLSYGLGGDVPLAGDWTGKGYDSVGLWRPSNQTFYLRNSNTTGGADIAFQFGQSGDIPLVGDWTGQGRDGVGVYRPSNATFYLRNSLSAGPPDFIVTFGLYGDLPVVGDWTDQGKDTIGVYRPSNATFYLSNSNTGGVVALSVYYGQAGDKPLTGDWIAQGLSTIGVWRPSAATFYLDAGFTSYATMSVPYGLSTDTPIVGRWAPVT